MDYKEFFRFTEQERRGILVFLILSITTIYIINCLEEDDTPPPADLSMYYIQNGMEADVNTISDKSFDAVMNRSDGESEPKDNKKLHRFEFNPNLLSADSLSMLGFSDFAVQNMIKYRQAGGQIKTISKLKTIYGIDTQLVQQLNDYIRFTSDAFSDSPEPNGNVAPSISKEKVQPFVELNGCDSMTLLAIAGVGPYTTKKILHYRRKLGGYLYVGQLQEFGLVKDSLYQIIAPLLSTDVSLIRKIDINSADFKTLVSHPYFSSETANAILKYRKQHGPFEDARHISRIRALKEETGNRILPYLKAEKPQ